MDERDKPESEREPKFSLNRETVEDLGAEEGSEEGAASTFSCCVGCNTDGSKSFCPGKTGC